MGSFLDKPKTEKNTERHEGNGMRVGMSDMQGWRVDMEVRRSRRFCLVLLRAPIARNCPATAGTTLAPHVRGPHGTATVVPVGVAGRNCLRCQWVCGSPRGGV